MAQRAISREVPLKSVQTHSICILVVCIIFGIVNFIESNAVTAIATLAMGVVVPLVALFVMKNANTDKRGAFLTQATSMVIMVLSATKGELHAMFTLLTASLAVGCIYYNLKTINYVWILTDVALVAAVFFKDTFYSGASTDLIIKGIIGFNIGAFMTKLLLKNCIDSINIAKEAKARADGLVDQVTDQMEEGQRLTEQQQQIMDQVSEISSVLDNSTRSMLDISGRLTQSSGEQADKISHIHTNVQRFAEDTSNCFTAAEKASDAAVESSDMLEENNKNMQSMMEAMRDISDTSNRISTIIKTIDDISFQTNILALNAAVEAARAGVAGKGFAVVADEVRNLANKSAEAAKNTASLITEAIEAVEKGTVYAQKAADQMDGIISCSKRSEEYSKRIALLTENQQQAITDINRSIAEVSEGIADNTQIAAESADIAKKVSNEIDKMNILVASR